MSIDSELETWRREWQSDAAAPPDLRRRVQRESRWLKIGIAAEVLVTVVIGGGVIALAARLSQPHMLLLAAATWSFIAAAWAFRLAITRGIWSPAAIDTAAFLDLSIRRCRAQLKAVVFGAGLFVCEIAFCLGWIYRYSAARTPLLQWLFGSWFNGLVWLFSLAFFVFIVWYRRKKRAELAWLLSLTD
ncbi:MAG TPA: hypothetical protein VMQ86_13185 [Bryobacteraceae bacterium]|jgi:hypothetical protein|nr:hypothetical protein [Bryobacteraceae bacterium]